MPREPILTSSLYILGPPSTANCPLVACAKQLKVQLRFFSQVTDFLSEVLNEPPDCLVLDLDSFSNAIELQAELTRRGCRAVVIATATELDVDTVLGVMEQGALTVLKKPLQAADCEHYLRGAIALARQDRELQFAYSSFEEKQATLTSRQREVLWLVLDGLPTKTIAAKLDVSNRLVELERARLLRIFEAESTTELALKVGEFLMLQRTMAHRVAPHFSKLRSTVARRQSETPDEC